MSRKRDKIEVVIAKFQGQDLDAHYLGYFECFNRQHFYEAHEVLEELWLTERGGPRDLFYKALIQLAGSFVHLRKNRPQPARALLQLVQMNLSPYPAVYERLDLTELRRLVGEWLRRPETAPASPKLLLAER